MGCMHAKVGNAFVLCGYQDSNIEVSCGAAAALQGLGDGSRLAIILETVRAQFLCCCCGHPISTTCGPRHDCALLLHALQKHIDVPGPFRQLVLLMLMRVGAKSRHASASPC